MKTTKTLHGCNLGRVISDVSQAHQGFGSRKHRNPQASSGDPASVPSATPSSPTRERPGPHNPPPLNYSTRTGMYSSGAWRDEALWVDPCLVCGWSVGLTMQVHAGPVHQYRQYGFLHKLIVKSLQIFWKVKIREGPYQSKSGERGQA